QDDVETVRTDQRGVYMGATQAYLPEDRAVARTYLATMLAISDCEFFILSAEAFAEMIREWFPMALHLLQGLFFGMQNTQAVVGQRQRLPAPGSRTSRVTAQPRNTTAA